MEAAPRPRPVWDAVAARVQAVLVDSVRWTGGKQRLTATRLHELLVAEGHRVGVTVVKDAVAEWKRQRREVFVPLTYRPGDLAEVDFFEVLVDVDGTRRKAWLFLMRLMYSGRDFAWIYERQDQVSFLDGHVRAFAHFDGVPARVAYDNLRAAVVRTVAVTHGDAEGPLEMLLVLGSAASPDTPNEPCAQTAQPPPFACEARNGVRTISMRSLRNTSSTLSVNFWSRIPNSEAERTVVRAAQRWGCMGSSDGRLVPARAVWTFRAGAGSGESTLREAESLAAVRNPQAPLCPQLCPRGSNSVELGPTPTKLSDENRSRNRCFSTFVRGGVGFAKRNPAPLGYRRFS